MVCVSMGVSYQCFGKNDISGNFFTFKKKYFASVHLFFISATFWWKNSKSDFGSPLATPLPIDEEFFILPDFHQSFTHFFKKKLSNF